MFGFYMALSSSFPSQTVLLIHNLIHKCCPAHATTNMDMEMVPFALLAEETTYSAATNEANSCTTSLVTFSNYIHFHKQQQKSVLQRE